MIGDSRQRILEHIKRKNECSATELGRALGLTAVTIRHHLEALQREGLVGKPTFRRKPGPGRPEMAFRLTAQAEKHMPRAYEGLCLGLLEGLQDALSQEAVEALLRKSASQVAKPAALGADQSLASRLPRVRNFLDQQGFFPRIETRGQELVIALSSCPFLEVARSMEHLCSFCHGLVQSLVGGEVSLQGSIAIGDASCRLHVSPARSA